ncbi:MAG: hypothetical protein ABFS35_07330 [Bacteroidota bacterium]
MNRFKETFRTKLYETIEFIENNSLIEMVVIIKPQSGKYRDIPVWNGIIFSFLLYTFFMFSPFEFGVYMIYGMTILSFFFVYGLFSISNLLRSFFTKKTRMTRNVEINARAIFQKGGVRFTEERIGTLVYVSLYEKLVFVLPDRGAENAIPVDEWKEIKQDFQSIFDSSDVPGELINKLNKWQPVFAKYIPPVENDINELPDDMNVEL